MTLVPMKINDGRPRNGIGQLISVAHMSDAQWKRWLVRELSKVPGGLDGLVKTESGYTNQIQLQEVA